MLSICIPVYNVDVSALVAELYQQIQLIVEPIEIILIDDGSQLPNKELNKKILYPHQHISLEKNIGRAAIRNLFLKYAQYDTLLFLDCDTIISSPIFLLYYINFIKTDFNKVACGGRTYPSAKPSREKLLSWKYGTFIESKTGIERNKNVSHSFMTNNFIIKKNVLQLIPFDETLVEYGHEDTLFGYELAKNSIIIQHIDNPILNGDLERNKIFIKKTEKAIKNLNQILERNNYDINFINQVKLLRFVYNVKPTFLLKIISFIFFIIKPIIKFLLTKGFANMALYNFYKLGLFLSIAK